jgi:prepilin-type processing-associated H-X9-DG protein
MFRHLLPAPKVQPQTSPGHRPGDHMQRPGGPSLIRTPYVRAHGRIWRTVAILALAIGASNCFAPFASAQEAVLKGKFPSLARYFPAQDLVVYLEFDGLDTHQESWQKTAAFRLLNETTTGVMYRAALPRIFTLLLREEAEIPLNGRELTDLALHLFRFGFAVGINRAGGTGPPRSFAIVLRGAAEGEIHQVLDRVLRGSATRRSGAPDAQKPGGRIVHQQGAGGAQTLAWWAEGDDIVISLVSSHSTDAVIDALDGRVKNAVAHPTRQTLLQSADLPGFEPVGVAFFEMAALPPLPREAVSLGLDRVKRFEYRWGFHGDALLSIVGAAAPAPRTGIPALFDQPKLDRRNLPPLPAGLADVTVVSLDESQIAPRLRESLATIIQLPETPERSGPDQLAAALKESLGLSLHDDLFAHLGTRFTFYNVATKVNAPSHIIESFAQGLFRAPKMALVAEVKNRHLLARSIEKLFDRVQKRLVSVAGQPNELALFSIARLKNGETGFVLTFVGSEFSVASTLRPTLLLGERTLVLAATPAMARRAREHAEANGGGGLPPGDPLAASLDWLPSNLTMLSVADTAHSVYPELLVGAPGLAESLLRSRRFMPFPFQMDMEIPLEIPIPGTVTPGNTRPSSALPPWDPELVPDPDDLRPFLFPSVHALAVDDAGIRFLSREAIPTFNPATAVPVALAALLPAIRQAQISLDRARSTNNLKQIGLAFHNFHQIHDHFPSDIRGKAGKPLLSWKVAILPFLEQGDLFSKFRLDEPWDSAHNKPLIAQMPSVFTIAGDAPVPGHTFYRGFSGTGAIFDSRKPEGVNMIDITDGSTNTFLIVEAKEAVPWTKPDSDLTLDDDVEPQAIKAMLDKVGGHSRGGFNALFCDGSVRFIRSTISIVVFRALCTRAAGEVISSDSF